MNPRCCLRRNGLWVRCHQPLGHRCVVNKTGFFIKKSFVYLYYIPKDKRKQSFIFLTFSLFWLLNSALPINASLKRKNPISFYSEKRQFFTQHKEYFVEDEKIFWTLLKNFWFENIQMPFPLETIQKLLFFLIEAKFLKFFFSSILNVKRLKDFQYILLKIKSSKNDKPVKSNLKNFFWKKAPALLLFLIINRII